MKILFLGCVEFSRHCLNELIKNKADIVAVLGKSKSDFNADFRDLRPLAKRAKIPYHVINDINGLSSEKLIRKYNPDVIFCFGWSEMIKPRILNIPRLGVIGTHPSALPQNRGRHPIIWALDLGLTQSAMTFFRMNNSADAGDIVSQKFFPITYNDDAASIYRKIKELASRQLKEFVPKLNNGKLKVQKQRKAQGNTWRKRGINDGKIDWRMSKRAIYNLVRSLTRPYVGAHCLYDNKEVKVWRVKEKTAKESNFEPGKVLSRRGNRILVKAYDGAIEITQHEFKKLPKPGEYLKW